MHSLERERTLNSYWFLVPAMVSATNHFSNNAE